MLYFRALSILIALSVFFPNTGMSEVYKWTDEQGNIHFGDRPPNREVSENISESLESTNLSTDLSNPDMIRRAEEARIETRKREYQSKAQAYMSQEDRENALKKWCAQAQERLTNISGRVVFYDSDGAFVDVTEKEREDMAKKLRSDIKTHCQ